MCVNGWSAEHDEWNCKAQKNCFRDVRASPCPLPPLQYTVSHAQTGHQRGPGSWSSDLGPFCPLFQMGYWGMSAAFWNYSLLLLSFHTVISKILEKGEPQDCADSAKFSISWPEMVVVVGMVVGMVVGGGGGWNKQSRERRNKMAMKAEEETKLIKPFWSSLQGPACDEAEWLPEGLTSCHLLGEWTRSLNWSELNHTKTFMADNQVS